MMVTTPTTSNNKRKQDFECPLLHPRNSNVFMYSSSDSVCGHGSLKRLVLDKHTLCIENDTHVSSQCQAFKPSTPSTVPLIPTFTSLSDDSKRRRTHLEFEYGHFVSLDVAAVMSGNLQNEEIRFLQRKDNLSSLDETWFDFSLRDDVGALSPLPFLPAVACCLNESHDDGGEIFDANSIQPLAKRIRMRPCSVAKILFT